MDYQSTTFSVSTAPAELCTCDDNVTMEQCPCITMVTSTTLRGVFVVIELVLMVAIAMGNVLVIMAFARSPQLRTVSHYLILQLAVADLSVALWMPMHMAMFVWPTILTNIKLAVLRYASLTLSMGASLLALVFLTMDRFMAIVRPLHYFGHLTMRRCTVLGLSVWLPPLVLGFILPLSWHMEWHEMEVRSHDFVMVLKTNYIRYIILPYLFVSFVVILTLYIPILHASRKHIKAMVRDARIGVVNYPPNSFSIIRDASNDIDVSQWSVQLNIVTPEAVSLEHKPSFSSTYHLFQTSSQSNQNKPNNFCAPQTVSCNQHTRVVNVNSSCEVSLDDQSVSLPVPPRLQAWTSHQDTSHCVPSTSTERPDMAQPNIYDSTKDSVQEITENTVQSFSTDGETSVTSATPPETQEPSVYVPQLAIISARTQKLAYTCSTLSEIKMFKTGGIVFAAFFLSWIPFTVVTAIQVYGDRMQDPGLVAAGPYVAFLAILNSALNPVVYAFKLNDFKVQFRRMLGLKVTKSRLRVSDLFSVKEARTG